MNATSLPGAPGGGALDVTGLAKAFGGVHALQDVHLTVAPSSVTSLIGPNGSGKSTSINLITGMYRADAGQVIAFGEDITRAKTESIARMGIIRTFQTPRLFPSMTALENVLTGAHIHVRTNFLSQAVGVYRRSRAERELREQARELLDIVGLADRSGENPAALSTGSQKLLDLVRALMARPRLLMLDEPAAGLNDAETAELGRLMGAMRDIGLTVVFVEHNMSLVLSVSDQIIALDRGRVVFDGEPDAFRVDKAVSDAFLGKVGDDE